MYSRKNGYTLAELLFVIIVIVILASGMMLAATSISDSADASMLISDLRNIKSASLVWLSDNLVSDDVELGEVWTGGEMPIILSAKYMDNKEKTFDFDYRYDLAFGFLVGKSVPQRIADFALKQARGILYNESGVQLDEEDVVTAVYIKVK